MEGWKRAEPRDALDRGSWWEIFGDPELDALAARVDVSNQNIRLAEANFRQARALAEQARAGLLSDGRPRVRPRSAASRRRFGTQRPSAITNVAASASWELDLWGRMRRSIESGEANWQASAADLESVRLVRAGGAACRPTSRCASPMPSGGCSRTPSRPTSARSS